jgi:NADH dehydrogenase FAD-containing subunit
MNFCRSSNSTRHWAAVGSNRKVREGIMSKQNGRPRVVIVVGGFGGLYAAKGLANRRRVGHARRPQEPSHLPADCSLKDVNGAPEPGLAAAAMQESKATAVNILRDVRGEARVPYRYRDRGSMATIGRDLAVARLRRLEFSGYVARMLWALVLVALLGEARNRFMVPRGWLWARYTSQRSARLITEDTYGR